MSSVVLEVLIKWGLIIPPKEHFSWKCLIIQSVARQGSKLQPLRHAETANTSDFSSFLPPFAGLSSSLDDEEMFQEATTQEP